MRWKKQHHKHSNTSVGCSGGGGGISIIQVVVDLLGGGTQYAKYSNNSDKHFINELLYFDISKIRKDI